MPVKGLSDDMRLPVMFRAKLGIRDPARNNAPREVDYFVLTTGAGDRTSESLKRVFTAYRDDKPKTLRMMLPLEMDAQHPRTGEELVWNLNNRAYGAGKGLRCKGNGGSAEHGVDDHGVAYDLRGTAETTDEGWAQRIAAATGQPAEPRPNGRWRIQCLGRDCPKYFRVDENHQGGGKVPMMKGHDPDAACKQLGVLRALLLTPAGEADVLGVIEIGTGSINSIRDIQSGLRMLRAFAGRTAAIPFFLHRKPTPTYFGGRKAIHQTCVVEPDYPNAQRWGMTPPEQVMLGVKDRAAYLAVLEGHPPDLDSVDDVVPQAHNPQLLTAPSNPNPLPPTDRDEAVATAPAEPTAYESSVFSPPDEAPSEMDRQCTAAERDELKALFGITNSMPQTDRVAAVAAFRGLVSRSYRETGASPPESTQLLGALTVKQYEWIKAHHEEGRG